MKSVKLFQLSKMERDALGEVMSIGMGHSSTALSKLLNEKIDMELMALEVLPIKYLSRKLGESHQLSTGVYVRINGTVSFILSRDSSTTLADILMHKRIGTTKVLGQVERSALEETTSILTGHYLTAMSDFLHINAIPTPPSTVFHLSGSIIDFILLGVDRSIEYGIVVHIKFGQEYETVKSDFVVLLDRPSLENIVESVNNTYLADEVKKEE
ncbi:MAG: chemotaxis protein CheC [Candidatus Altiarchaeota archaeon]|nr:chemotaxis protein CheC [Candidatus Altiarchaeota archaeon]